MGLNHALEQIDLTDFSLSNRIRTHILLYAHETFSRIDYVIGHIRSLSKFNKIEKILNIFSDHAI